MHLLEREHPLGVLTAALDRVRQREGSVVLIGGEAGMGKTSFVDHFLVSVAKPVQVLKGYCDPMSTPTPLGPLYDIAHRVGGKLLAQLEGGAPRAALFSTLLDQLAAQPTVLLIEDIHWADGATLDLLKFLGRRIQERAILVLLTYRDDEVGGQPALRMLLGDLAASKGAQRIGLPRLSIDAVRKLAAGRPVDVAALHRQTSGNAFYVTEVLASHDTGLPGSVRDAVLARVARLAAASRAALEAAAVIGPRIAPAFFEKVTGSADGLAECFQLGIIEADGNDIAFRHELARDAVLSNVDPARRRELNRRAFEALKNAGPGPGDLAQLVQYADGAGDAAAVVEHGLAAARAATAVGAHRQAAAHYARILDNTVDRPVAERAGYFEAYAEECLVLDQLAESARARREAIVLRRQSGDWLKQGENLAELAWPLVRSGRNADAEAACRQAIEVLECLAPSRQLANAYRTQAHLRMLDRDGATALRLGQKAIELAAHFDDTLTVAGAENAIGTALLVTGDEEGRRHLQCSIARARQVGADSLVGIGYVNMGAAYGEQYRFGEAERFLEEGLQYATERDLDHATHHLHAWLALTRLYQGRWREADAIATSVIDRPNAAVISRIMALVALGRVRTRRGEASATALLDEALELAQQTQTLQRLAPVRAARAEAAWLAGDQERTRAEANATFELAVRYRHRWHIGEFAYWRRLAGEIVEVPQWTALPFLLHTKGQWRAAAAAWEGLSCPYEEARALADGNAVAQVRALEMFNALGAAPAAAALRQRMRGAGLRRIPRGPRPTTRQNPFGLTRRELEILDCVASGLTNGRIGAKLHVSPKTVDHHVSSVLSKLGAATRGEAARIARAERLLPQNGEPAALN